MADPLDTIARICAEQPHDALEQIAVALGYTEQVEQERAQREQTLAGLLKRPNSQPSDMKDFMQWCADEKARTGLEPSLWDAWKERGRRATPGVDACDGYRTSADGLYRTRIAPDAAAPMVPSHSVRLVFGADGRAHPPCTVCGTAYDKHGTFPTCASHPYTADGKCGHVGTLVGSVFTGAPCAGAECSAGCVRARGSTDVSGVIASHEAQGERRGSELDSDLGTLAASRRTGADLRHVASDRHQPNPSGMARDSLRSGSDVVVGNVTGHAEPPGGAGVHLALDDAAGPAADVAQGAPAAGVGVLDSDTFRPAHTNGE